MCKLILILAFLASPIFGMEQYCEDGLPCDDPYKVCITGMCVCDVTTLAEVDPLGEGTNCRGRANGGKCSEDGSNGPICVGLATCINGSCQCNKGYSPTFDGQCLQEFGDVCYWYYPSCNPEQGLGCVNGRCGCQYSHQIWDSEIGLCVTKLGDVCERSTSDSNKPVCGDPNASCQHNRAMGTRPICRCNQGFRDVNGVCQPDPKYSGMRRKDGWIAV